MIEHKKQEEIKLLLKDAFEIKEEMQKIMKLTAEVSAKFSQVGDSIINLSNNISKTSKQFGKNTDYIGSGAMLVGSAVKLGGQLWAKYKENKLNKQMLPKKREIATAKIEIIRTLRKRVLKEHEMLEKFCLQEANKISDVGNNEKYDILQKGMKELLETYFIFKHLLHISVFFISEFEAWLANSHESGYQLLSGTDIYQECVNKVIENSKFPENAIQNEISMGAVLALSDEKVSKYAIQNEKITNYSKIISKNRIQNSLLFFTKNAGGFNAFYKNYIKYSTTFYFLTPLLFLIFTVGIGVSFDYFFDSIFWTIFGGLFGLGLSFITMRLFEKYLSNLKKKSLFKVTGFDGVKNEKILRKFKIARIKKLFLSVLIDLLGMATYLIDLFTGGGGEFVDVFWAPISGILILALYKERFGMGLFGAFFGMAEEISPFDFIPTASIMWLNVYVFSKDKTLEKMGYTKKAESIEVEKS